MGIFQRILMACGQDKPGVAGWRLKPAREGSGRPGADSFFAKKWRCPFGDGHDIQHSHLKAGAEARERLLPPHIKFTRSFTLHIQDDFITSIFSNIPKFHRFFDFALQAPLRMTPLQAFSHTFLSSKL